MRYRMIHVLATVLAVLVGTQSAPAQSNEQAARAQSAAQADVIVNVRDFGAVGDGETDDWQAFNKAIHSHPGNGTIAVRVPPGDYFLSKTLELDRSVSLIGEGGVSRSTSRLIFPPNTTGVRILSSQMTEDGEGGGNYSMLFGLSLRQRGRGDDPDAHGISLKQRAYIRYCAVRGFSGNGIHISADVNREPKSNANSWLVERVDVYHSGGHGFYTDGGDSNAGTAIALNCTHNGGWGVYDSSFLGNTYIGCHVSHNAKGAYKTDNPNARNVFLGCYAEGNQSESQINRPSIVVGGLHGAGVSGSGVHMRSSSDGLVSNQPVTVKNDEFEISIGEQFGLNLIGKDDHTRGLSFHWTGENYLFQHGNLNKRRAMLFTGEANSKTYGRSAPVAAGNVGFPDGFFLGNGKQGRYTGRVRNDPDYWPDAAKMAVGDRLYFSNPSAGGYVGVICVTQQDGDEKVWRRFGKIETAPADDAN